MLNAGKILFNASKDSFNIKNKKIFKFYKFECFVHLNVYLDWILFNECVEFASKFRAYKLSHYYYY